MLPVKHRYFDYIQVRGHYLGDPISFHASFVH